MKLDLFIYIISTIIFIFMIIFLVIIVCKTLTSKNSIGKMVSQESQSQKLEEYHFFKSFHKQKHIPEIAHIYNINLDKSHDRKEYMENIFKDNNIENVSNFYYLGGKNFGDSINNIFFDLLSGKK